MQNLEMISLDHKREYKIMNNRSLSLRKIKKYKRLSSKKTSSISSKLISKLKSTKNVTTLYFLNLTVKLIMNQSIFFRSIRRTSKMPGEAIN